MKYRIVISKNVFGGKQLYRVDSSDLDHYHLWEKVAYFNTAQEAQEHIDLLKKFKIGEAQ